MFFPCRSPFPISQLKTTTFSNSTSAITRDPPPRPQASASFVNAVSVLMRYFDAGYRSATWHASSCGIPLLLGQSAPDAERLGEANRMLSALLEHGTPAAYLFGRLLAAHSCEATLSVGMKEDGRVVLTARGIYPPVPLVSATCPPDLRLTNLHCRPKKSNPASRSDVRVTLTIGDWGRFRRCRFRHAVLRAPVNRRGPSPGPRAPGRGQCGASGV